MKDKLSLRVFITILLLGLSIFLGYEVINNAKYGLDLNDGYEYLYKEEGSSKDLKNTIKVLEKRLKLFGINNYQISTEKGYLRIRTSDEIDDKNLDKLSNKARITIRDSKDNVLLDSSDLRDKGLSVGTSKTGETVLTLGVSNNSKLSKETKKVSEDDGLIVIWLDFKSGNSYSSDQNKCGLIASSNCLAAAKVSGAYSGDISLGGSWDKTSLEELLNYINLGSINTDLELESSSAVSPLLEGKVLNKLSICLMVILVIMLITYVIIFRLSGLITSINALLYLTTSLFLGWAFNIPISMDIILSVLLGFITYLIINTYNLYNVRKKLDKNSPLRKSFDEVFSNRSFDIKIYLILFFVSILLNIFGEMNGFVNQMYIMICMLILCVLINKSLIQSYVNTNLFKDKTNALIGSKKRKTHKLPLETMKKVSLCLAIIALIGSISLFVKGFNYNRDLSNNYSVYLDSDDIINKDDLKGDSKKLKAEIFDYVDMSNDMVNFKIKGVSQNKIKDYFAKKYDSKVTINKIDNKVNKDNLKKNCYVIIISFLILALIISLLYSNNHMVYFLLVILVSSLFTLDLISLCGLNIDLYLPIALFYGLIISSISVFLIFDSKKFEDNFYVIVYSTISNILISLILLVFVNKYLLTFSIFNLIYNIINILMIFDIDKRKLKINKKKEEFEKEEVEELTVKGIND